MEKDSMWKRICKIAKYVVIPVLMVIAFRLLFKFVDYIAEGSILDSFDNRFGYEYMTTDSNGNEMLVHTYAWGAVKSVCLNMSFIIIPILAVTLIVVSEIKKRNHKRADSKRISAYIDRYIINEEALPADIPTDYADTFAKLSEVKLKEQKREQQLLEETARKDDLVTYLAHDLKTPLTSVIGYLTLLKDEPDLSDNMRNRYTDIAVAKSVRLEELVNELFEITRYNIHNVELEKGRINLSLMLEQIVFEFNPLLSDKKLSFNTDIRSDVELYCDADKMERVIDNLIRNAIHYSYEGTAIEIKLDVEKDDNDDSRNILLSVSNKGRTIPKDKLERIFEQFFRVDSSRSTNTGGSGLGLAIAKQLVEAHGGTITAESENEEIKFVVKLPS